jgi:hypothetical protein
MFLAQNPKPLTAESAEKSAENAEKSATSFASASPKLAFGS